MHSFKSHRAQSEKGDQGETTYKDPMKCIYVSGRINQVISTKVAVLAYRVCEWERKGSRVPQRQMRGYREEVMG